MTHLPDNILVLSILSCRDVLRLSRVPLQVVDGHVPIGQANGQHVRVARMNVHSRDAGAGVDSKKFTNLLTSCTHLLVICTLSLHLT